MSVQCKCEECQFNTNMKCTADNIEVLSNGDLKANSSAGTMCNTFKPK